MTDISELFKMAEDGTLPDGFSQWDLADNNGWSVAHMAADYGHLPADFNDWDLKDNKGVTVSEVKTSADRNRSYLNN